MLNVLSKAQRKQIIQYLVGNNWLRPSTSHNRIDSSGRMNLLFLLLFALYTQPGSDVHKARVVILFTIDILSPFFILFHCYCLPVYTISNRKIMQSTLILTLSLSGSVMLASFTLEYMACKMRMGLAVLQNYIHTNVTFFFLSISPDGILVWFAALNLLVDCL